MRETCPGVPVRMEKDDHSPSTPSLSSLLVLRQEGISNVCHHRTKNHLAPMRWASGLVVKQPFGDNPGSTRGSIRVLIQILAD